jgi:hypothetical protein
MKLLLPLLLCASPALADEATVAAARHRDFPTSELYVSPADASRFNAPIVGVTFRSTRSLYRADFTSGEENDDARGFSSAMRVLRKASPSFYWGIALEQYEEQDEANNTLITGDRKLATELTRTEGGLEAAYKMMDKVVLGLGAKYRRVQSKPDTGKSADLTMPVLETALLVRSEWYEVELAQRAMAYPQNGDDGKEPQVRRETTLAGRYRSSATLTTGLRATHNPFPPCCLAPKGSRTVYALSAEIHGDGLKHEAFYSYLPAYHADDQHEITRHGLSYTAFYDTSKTLTIQAGLAGERGETKGSEVRIPTASGYETKADVEVFSWSFSTGVALAF